MLVADLLNKYSHQVVCFTCFLNIATQKKTPLFCFVLLEDCCAIWNESILSQNFKSITINTRGSVHIRHNGVSFYGLLFYKKFLNIQNCVHRVNSQKLWKIGPYFWIIPLKMGRGFQGSSGTYTSIQTKSDYPPIIKAKDVNLGTVNHIQPGNSRCNGIDQTLLCSAELVWQ